MKLKLSLLALLTFMLGEGYLIYYFNFYLTKNMLISIIFVFMILGSISFMVYIDLDKLSKSFTLLSIVICITSSLFMVSDIRKNRSTPTPLETYPKFECGKETYVIDRNSCRSRYEETKKKIDIRNKTIELKNIELQQSGLSNLTLTDVILTIVRIILSIIVPFATHAISVKAKWMYEDLLNEKKVVIEKVYEETVKKTELNNESEVVKLFKTGHYSMYQIAKQLKLSRHVVERELIEKGLHVRNKRKTTYNNKRQSKNNLQQRATTINNEENSNIIEFRRIKEG
jgi:hypothetical protein